MQVDTETGLVRVVKYVAACDCGCAINPQLAEGQVEGSVANGLSNAIYDAVGVRLRKTPFTPEAVLQALDEKEAKQR